MSGIKYSIIKCIVCAFQNMRFKVYRYRLTSLKLLIKPNANITLFIIRNDGS